MLWKILLLCILVGGAQWMHAHPDSEMTQQFLVYFAKVRAEWDLFVAHFTMYLNQFPTYIHQLMDTTPKPTPAK